MFFGKIGVISVARYLKEWQPSNSKIFLEVGGALYEVESIRVQVSKILAYFYKVPWFLELQRSDSLYVAYEDLTKSRLEDVKLAARAAAIPSHRWKVPFNIDIDKLAYTSTNYLG